jgi:hypothetical protein
MDLTLLVRFSVWRIGTSSEETPPAAAIAVTAFSLLARFGGGGWGGETLHGDVLMIFCIHTLELLCFSRSG